LNVDFIGDGSDNDNEIKLVTVDMLKPMEAKDSLNPRIRPFIHKSLNETETEIKKEN